MSTYEIIENFNGREKRIAIVKAYNEDEIIRKVSNEMKIPKNKLYSNMFNIKKISD